MEEFLFAPPAAINSITTIIHFITIETLNL